MTLPLAVSLGDPAGIGAEVIAKSWERRELRALPAFFVVGEIEAVRAVWNGPVEAIASPADAQACFGRALPVLTVGDGCAVSPGRPDIAGARSALDALELAVGLTRSGAAAAIVTGPVSKAQLYGIGFAHPGQTEFVAERCGIAAANVAMMLAGPSLRTVPVTTHLPLADVPAALTVELIVGKGRTVIRGLRRQFGIMRPRLAVAGLNPHAGENGALGREDIELIAPAVARLCEEDEADLVGPLAADSMFHASARSRYDAALCMYHDQALIPLKALHFDEGVNITLGLPIVRTSPDHGTAFDIAGRNQADPAAMVAAIALASSCAARLAAG
ncbi:MAG TPA: 4-hydroxythreonine-4-phosphate dehydrogenase PdxA [Allosphingosinicella sp.]|nr:4-hydroxythreonine-4-phosphate dehydrogenase PdxA [Allosphingosinicella sp.]